MPDALQAGALKRPVKENMPAMELLAQALNLIMQPCYQLTGNWWLAILLFTVIVKVILLPMSLWCQKNSIVMVQLMPDLNRIKVK